MAVGAAVVAGAVCLLGEMLEGLEDTRSVFVASHFYLDAWHNLSKIKKRKKKKKEESPSLFLAGGVEVEGYAGGAAGGIRVMTLCR